MTEPLFPGKAGQIVSNSEILEALNKVHNDAVEADMRSIHKMLLSFFKTLAQWERGDIPKHGMINVYKSIIEMAQTQIALLEAKK